MEQQVGSRIIQTFHHFLEYYQESNLACGMIIARADLNAKELEKLKAHMERLEPEVGVQFSHDQTEGLVGILLDNRTIGYSHFYSLYVKDFLEENGFLSGSILVGSFPESSPYAEQMLFDMVSEIISENGPQGEIRVFKKENKKKNDSILIVDSDEKVLELVTSYFTHKGYTVHTATDGKEGVAQYEKHHPSLVITEINLSALGGYQFIHHIQHLEAVKAAPIMVLTNKQLEEDVKRTFEYGVSDYVTKPFSLMELESRMVKLLQAVHS
ncbi:response regulator [Pontibacillus salipaludis]|uniref:response regulator transcription factor n=1 Tax=Pontibacillus salipaludis TaxID=1697394 RepID=UPI0031EF9B3A